MKIKVIEIELNNLKGLDGEYVDMVNENFWNLFQDDLVSNNPCLKCPNNKSGQMNICNCTLPYMNRTIC